MWRAIIGCANRSPQDTVSAPPLRDDAVLPGEIARMAGCEPIVESRADFSRTQRCDCVKCFVIVKGVVFASRGFIITVFANLRPRGSAVRWFLQATRLRISPLVASRYCVSRSRTVQKVARPTRNIHEETQ